MVYINPPYAEASDKKTLITNKEGKQGVEQSLMNKKYASLLGQGNAEIFAQFFIRINKEISNCLLAEFSTLKILQGQHFSDFRKNFRASLERIFIVPADTFDNVKGKFPIGFMIWDTSKDESFTETIADVFNKSQEFLCKKHIIAYNDNFFINEWIKPYRADKKDTQIIGKFPFKGNDFQNQNMIAIVHNNMIYNKEAGQFLINSNNLIYACVYYSVRHCIEATWLNDRDQFLFPKNKWEKDLEFQRDCLTYTLFSNNIQSKFGTNHWIPFTEKEVGAKGRFESHFMTDFLSGPIRPKIKKDIFTDLSQVEEPMMTYQATPQFSDEAKAVFDAGRELWTYYHSNKYININASLYDIREHYQGRNDKGKMNNKSLDEKYNELISTLRVRLKVLAKKIEPKVYEYEFLKA